MTASERRSTPRWDPYLMSSGAQFRAFWQDLLRSRNRRVLYVLGRGFDPRMCSGLEVFLTAGTPQSMEVLVIQYHEGPNSPSEAYAPFVTENLKKVNELVGKRGNLRQAAINVWSDTGPSRRRIASRQAASIFSGNEDIDVYTDVIVDISAMPRSIYFSLIGKILFLLDHPEKGERPRTNLHVVVSEDAELDQQIRDVGTDDRAEYIHGFGGADLQMEATSDVPRVWIPILGEDQTEQLERIYTLVNPDEICPVLPSPARNPRRGDELLLGYRELLLDRWRIEPANFIYASEQNPFEAYRQIQRSVEHYSQALRPLGGCRVAISALASKLLSVGALLAVYELRSSQHSVGLAHVEARGYQMTLDQNEAGHTREGELYTLWLAGECYED